MIAFAIALTVTVAMVVAGLVVRRINNEIRYREATNERLRKL